MMNVYIYEREDGHKPFETWLKTVNSKTAKSRILKQLNKLEAGLITDCKPLGGGVHEIRLHFEKGYRLYFGYDGDTLVILLTGSNKGTQKKAISAAKELWAEYKARKKSKNKSSDLGDVDNETCKKPNSTRAKKG